MQVVTYRLLDQLVYYLHLLVAIIATSLLLFLWLRLRRERGLLAQLQISVLDLQLVTLHFSCLDVQAQLLLELKQQTDDSLSEDKVEFLHHFEGWEEVGL